MSIVVFCFKENLFNSERETLHYDFRNYWCIRILLS